MKSDVKSFVSAIFAITATINTASATELYWKIVDGNGKLLGNVSGDYSRVADLEKMLQNTYPGIKLSIGNCRQPNLVESMNSVYGKYWQCGTIIYASPVVRSKPKSQSVRFPPSSSQWHFLGHDGANNIMFVNEPHRLNGHIFVWTTSYSAFALADAISMHKGESVYAIELEDEHVSAELRKAADDIVDADPSEIGGNTYRTNGHTQKSLYEIDCSSRRMRYMQSQGARGEIFNSTNGSALWYRPTMIGGKLALMQRECGQ